MSEVKCQDDTVGWVTWDEDSSKCIKYDHCEHKIIGAEVQISLGLTLAKGTADRRRSRFFTTTVSRRKYLFSKSCWERTFFFSPTGSLLKLAFEDLGRCFKLILHWLWDGDFVWLGSSSISVSVSGSFSSSVSVSVVVQRKVSLTINSLGMVEVRLVQSTEGIRGTRLAMALGLP